MSFVLVMGEALKKSMIAVVPEVGRPGGFGNHVTLFQLPEV